MFCQSCGTQLTQGLVYCNRCGARVLPHALQRSGPPPEKLAEVLFCLAVMSALVSLGGFAFIYALTGRLLGQGLDQGRALVIVIFCLAAVVGVSALLIRQFSRALTVFLQTGRHPKDEARGPELAGRNTAQIEAPREPAASVTDHTTRTFDPAYVERGKSST